MTQLFGSTDTTKYEKCCSGCQMLHQKVLCTASGTLTSLSFYTSNEACGTSKIAIYNSTGSSLLGSGIGTVTAVEGWHTISFSTPVSVTVGTYYYIAIKSNAEIHLYYNAGGTLPIRYDDVSYSSFPEATLSGWDEFANKYFSWYGSSGGQQQLIGIATWNESGYNTIYQNMFGTRFTATLSGYLNAINIFVESYDNASWKVAIYNSDGTSMLGKGTLSGDYAYEYGWHQVELDDPVYIAISTQYRIVVTASNSTAYIYYDTNGQTEISWYHTCGSDWYSSFPETPMEQDNTYTNRAYGITGWGDIQSGYSGSDTARMADTLDIRATLKRTLSEGATFSDGLKLPKISDRVWAWLADDITLVVPKPVYYYETSTSSQFTLTAEDVLEFSGLTYDDQYIRNNVIVIGSSSDIYALTSDSTSIMTYGYYTYRYEDDNITNSSDAATIAGQILTNYKDPKKSGKITIAGKININPRQMFTLDLPEAGISCEVFELISYTHTINDKGFLTQITFGTPEWDISREVANLVRTVY